MISFEWPFIAFKVNCIRNSKVLTISSLTGTPVLKPVFGKITEIDIDSAEVTEVYIGSVATTICYIMESYSITWDSQVVEN